MTPTRPHRALPRSLQAPAGAPEASTWSTRSAASMNDVDTDKRRHTIGNKEGPDHRHNAEVRSLAHPGFALLHEGAVTRRTADPAQPYLADCHGPGPPGRHHVRRCGHPRRRRSRTRRGPLTPARRAGHGRRPARLHGATTGTRHHPGPAARLPCRMVLPAGGAPIYVFDPVWWVPPARSVVIGSRPSGPSSKETACPD